MAPPILLSYCNLCLTGRVHLNVRPIADHWDGPEASVRVGPFFRKKTSLLPILRLTPRTEGLRGGQRIAKVHSDEEILPKAATS